MYRSLKSYNAAPLGAASLRTARSSSRCTPLRRTTLDLRLLAALALSSLILLLIVEPAPAQTAGSVTVMPGSTTVPRKGLSVAVIAATDTGGNLDAARRALMAANSATMRWPNFVAISPSAVANALSRVDARGVLYAADYQAIAKRLKADRLMTITLMPGPQTDGSSNYTAVAELYDGKSGGLVGRGEAPFTATADNAPAAGAAADLHQRAIDSAVAAAIVALNEPAALHGVVVTVPAAYQARLSVGERNGLRNGARVEYLANGQPIAYGTVISVDEFTAVATVASEAANPSILINTEFRTVTNPPVNRAGDTVAQTEEKDWKKFERNFAIAAIPALAYQYYLYGF